MTNPTPPPAAGPAADPAAGPSVQRPANPAPLTLTALDRALRASWAADTCSPDDVARTPWHRDNPAWGHCDITALLVHDLFGGLLLVGEVHHAGSPAGHHWWNLLDSGIELDLTREQFRLGQTIGPPRALSVPRVRSAAGRRSTRCCGRGCGTGWDCRPPADPPPAHRGRCRRRVGRTGRRAPADARPTRGSWGTPGMLGIRSPWRRLRRRTAVAPVDRGRPGACARPGAPAGRGEGRPALTAIVLCILFALLGAASNATGTVLQRKAALSVPPEHALRPRLLVDMVRQPVWLLGICGVAGAALFQALALVAGPLALAQPVFILELPFALLIAMPVLHRALPSSGWIAVACMVGGLVVGLASAAPSGGVPQAPMTRWIPALIVCGGAVAFTVTEARRRPSGAARAALLGTAAAIGNALTAALMKSAADTFSHQGGVAFLTAWQTYGFAVCGIAAVFLLENSLQAGSIAASQPALTLGDATVSLLLGVTLYNEHIRTGWWLLPELAAVAVITFGTLHLSRAIPLTRELSA